MEIDDLKNNPEQIKLLISVLSSLLPDATQESTKVEKPKNKRKSKKESTNTSDVASKPNIRTARGKAQGSGTNKFDNMSERNLHKEDVVIDKKLSKFPPTERTRQFEYIQVQCRCCGKKEMANPGLLLEVDRYKCNKCAISAG
jgi:hypothetical protein